MGIRLQRDTVQLGSVTTSRFITIPTTPVTLITMNSAVAGAFIYNVGTPIIMWGGSTIGVNSGAFLFPYSGMEWVNVEDGYSFYAIADSVAGYLTINEYRIP